MVKMDLAAALKWHEVSQIEKWAESSGQRSPVPKWFGPKGPGTFNGPEVVLTGSLHLPKRPEIPERPRNTGKTSEWLNTFSGDCGEGVGRFNLIFKNVLMSIFECSYNKKI